MTNKFQKNITQIMAERNLTQSRLSEIIHVRQGQVSNWIHGKSFPTYSSLDALRSKLKISSEELFKE
jgi:transcriptional regulator with XRE-family HTH domain